MTRRKYSSRVATVAILGPGVLMLLAIGYLSFGILLTESGGMDSAPPEWLANADVFFHINFFRDWMAGTYPMRGWALPPAPAFFPDAVLQYVPLILSDSVHLALLAYWLGIPLIGVLANGLRPGVFPFRRDIHLLWSLLAVSLWYALLVWQGHTSSLGVAVLRPGHHGGASAMAWLCFMMLITGLYAPAGAVPDATNGIRIISLRSAVLFVLIVFSTASDFYFIPAFCLPWIAVAILHGLYTKRWLVRETLLSVCAVLCGMGLNSILFQSGFWMPVDMNLTGRFLETLVRPEAAMQEFHIPPDIYPYILVHISSMIAAGFTLRWMRSKRQPFANVSSGSGTGDRVNLDFCDAGRDQFIMLNAFVFCTIISIFCAVYLSMLSPQRYFCAVAFSCLMACAWNCALIGRVLVYRFITHRSNHSVVSAESGNISGNQFGVLLTTGGFIPTALLTAVTFSVFIMFGGRMITPGKIMDWQPERIACVADLARRNHWQMGLSDYWNAGPARAYLHSVEVNDALPRPWIRNLYWLFSAEPPAEYRFVLMDGLQKDAWLQTYGQPSRIRHCGIMEIFEYDDDSAELLDAQFAVTPAQIAIWEMQTGRRDL